LNPSRIVHDNRVEFRGVIAGTSGLRHTPAGIASLSLTLRHESRQLEAGHPRQVRFETPAQAFGGLAETLARLADGSTVQVSGFLDRQGVRDSRLVLHITEFELFEE